MPFPFAVVHFGHCTDFQQRNMGNEEEDLTEKPLRTDGKRTPEVAVWKLRYYYLIGKVQAESF